MRAAFLGTPSAAVPCLAAVADVVDVTVVVTRPDRARGRGRKPGETAVKVAAREWGLRTAQPEGIADLERVLGQANVDVAIVVAYGMLLPTRVLTLAATGFLNVHFSLLPRWRGAAPVERAILEGDERTGVSLMLIDEGVDTGPIISVVETPIGADETGGSLTARLSYLGAELIDDALPGYLAGRRSPAHQLDAGRTLAPALLRDEAQVDGSWPAARAERAIRAFNPRPGAWLLADDAILLVHASTPVDLVVEPGRITGVEGQPVLGLAGGALALTEVQPGGKQVMSGSAWLNGRRGEDAVVGRAT